MTTNNDIELKAQLEELSYTQEVKDEGIANMPNYYIIPKGSLKQFVKAWAAKQAVEARIDELKCLLDTRTFEPIIEPQAIQDRIAELRGDT